jgi:hypothetical protein
VLWPIPRLFQQLPARVGIKRRKTREDFTKYGTSVAHHDARFSERERVVRNKQSHDCIDKMGASTAPFEAPSLEASFGVSQN